MAIYPYLAVRCYASARTGRTTMADHDRERLLHGAPSWLARGACVRVACALSFWLMSTTASIVLAQAAAPAPPAPPALSRLDSLRLSLRLPAPPVGPILQQQARQWGSPGTSFGSPTAFGARFGDVFAGAGYQARTRYTHIRDGSVVGGFGLFDP